MKPSRFPMREGQFPKCCELCEKDNKIKWKCINCNLLMCNKCRNKVHSKFQYADRHQITDVKNVRKHSNKLDLSNINCEGHQGQNCVMFCKSCDQPVCPLCMAEEHHGHRFVQINEGYKIKVDKVKEIQQQIKSHIKELTNGESKIKLLRKDESSKYTETRNLIQAQNAALKRDIDKYTEKLIKELDQKWETLQNFIDKEEKKVTAMKTRKEDQSKKIEDIINSKDVEQVFKEGQQMGNIMNETVEPLKLEYTKMPNFIPGEINESNCGSLQDIPKELILNQQFTTDLNRLDYLSSCPDNSLWIRDDNVLQRVKPDGNNLKVVSRFNIKIYCMALTPSNDFLLKEKGSSKLKQFSGSSGQITESIYNVDPLVITALHVTSDYKVIVGAGDAADDDRALVIIMNEKGTHQHDRKRQRIFNYVLHITTTTNGTIFVVDRLSNDDRGRVVVLGQEGDVINTYTGHPKINSDYKPFKPRHVVTTPLDNIIVTEVDTHILHILNSVVQLITYYNTEDIGIQYPYCLSFTNTGQLYIGCTRAKGSTENAKLYKVGISQI